MKNSVKILVLFLFCLATLTGKATVINDQDQDAKTDKGVIAGRVIDEQNLSLPGATVVIKGTTNGSVSDENGFYRIINLNEGQYEIVVSYIGFKDQTKQVQVKANATTTVDFQLEAGIELNEVTVNGSLQGQSKALNQQKNSINVTNIISSDQVGRFPDANIGDALKRIPGINVQYDQGEARFGHIRGTPPELNSVTIDGDRIPSAEAEIRAVQLDLVPSDMIQTLEVNKVITSDMDADAIGGSVNLVTRSNPYKRRISGTVGTTYNLLTDKPAETLSLLYADRFLDDKLGMTLSGSYQNHKLGSDNKEAEWEDDGTMKEFQVRTYLLQRLRQSYSAAFDYQFDTSNKIDAKVIFNHRNDWENRYRIDYRDLDDDPGNQSIRRQTKAGTKKDGRLEDQRTLHFSLKGEHQLGNLEMKWKGSYAKASEDRPNERYIRYEIEDIDIAQDLSDTQNPQVIINNADARDLNSNWSLDEVTEEHQYTEDKDFKLAVDFKLPLSDTNNSKLKFGAKYKAKDKSRDNDFYDIDFSDEDGFSALALSNLSDQSRDDFLAGDYMVGKFVSKEFLGSLDLESSDFTQEQNKEELAGNFDASEDVFAAYLRFDQKIGDLDIVAGLRFENTSLEYSGYQIEFDNEGDITPDSPKKTDVEESSYSNLLPSLLLKYSLGENTQIKTAWTNTIARPRYFDLVPYVETNREDNEISVGNPELEATSSMNLDLMIEHYFKSVGLISGGLFYKDIKDFIVEEIKDDFNYNGETWSEFKQPINAGDASLFGLEFAFQRQFDFLPGFLRQFGIYTNYTYTKSEVSNFKIEDREDEELALPGTPEHNLNASLYYEGKKLSARLSINHASDFIDEVGGKAFEDRYYDKATHLDFNANYSFTKSLNAYVEVNNILNQPLSYYQGSSKFIMQDEYYDARINLGLKFNF